MELLEDFPCSNDLLIVKRKRTKRPRPSSSASSNGGGSDIDDSMLVSSPATTSSGISTSTEEDEDMANCLILLACGGYPPQLEADNKLSSRKFAEMATTTDGKVGIYVYECKTCNRTFPSFQALGGHRASHKRPKISADVIDRKKSPPATPSPHEQERGGSVPEAKITVLSPNKSFYAENSKSKIHECSICGSEFGSGQALGGHMRRHRSAPAVTNCTKSGTRIENDTASHDVSGKARNVFELDLNLPAPPEDDQRPGNFHEFSSNQQRRLVFSAAAPLVDCHY